MGEPRKEANNGGRICHETTGSYLNTPGKIGGGGEDSCRLKF